MRSLFFVITLLMACSASAETITFDEIETTFESEVLGITEFESGGFNFTTSGYMFLIRTSPENVFLGVVPPGPVTMELLSGGNFGVSSLDLGVGDGSAISLTGYYAGGGTVQSIYYYEDVSNPTLVLDSSWQNLQSIEMQSLSGANTFDNIVVNVVPIPAAVWLFGSALAGLGWLRRIQTV